MTKKSLTCSMCGYHFDPEAHSSCQTCPLGKGCHLSCCPNCGFENINIKKSLVARLAARFFPYGKASRSPHKNNLADVAPGRKAKVTGFALSIAADRKAHLQAYGIVPGNVVRVVQHSPVTVFQVDNTELALEKSLAEMVEVELIDSAQL